MNVHVKPASEKLHTSYNRRLELKIVVKTFLFHTG